MKKFSIGLLLLLTPLVQAQTEEPGQHSDKQWYDSFREGLAGTVDASARWVDGFFAEDRLSDSYSSYGRLSLAPQWSAYDGFELKSRFRAKVNLPHAKDELSAFIGRVDSDEFLDDASAGRPSVIRSTATDEEWLVGLGFDPHMNEQHRLSYSVGIRGGLDFDSYLRARYRTDAALGESALVRLQSSAFWRDSDGFGVAQRFDFEANVTDSILARWSALGTFAQETNGLRWSSSARAYKLYAEDKAMAVETWIEGQTDHAVPINDYGVRLLNRQRYLREWLFVETWVGYHRPRETVNEVRRGHWMLGLEIEIHFGTDNAYLPDSRQSKSTTSGS
ncbi:hypothetical protein [Idiomarina seosinensis]|uniref:Uncharacterized protein n=1 Tax=Idiomarina seosinensis TaxID=281739 RepID=A0A432ZIM2_9GAMM|nr:hypothetical protein [Idiomarina seosinensis]RUO77811.1 hypothetical protein CWI81_04845 [Idiomarina seosinensis]